MIALLLVGVAVACGCGSLWSWTYQKRVLRVLRVRASHVPRVDALPPALPSGRPAEPPIASDTAATRVAVQQLERATPATPSSVLGWEAFSLVSTLVFDGTVLLGCRRRADESFPELRGRPLPETPEDHATMVLLIGDDDRSEQAVDLLDRWRGTGATLRLRPTRIAGAIELFDERHSAIRAALLAD